MWKEQYLATAKRLHGDLAITWCNSLWTAVYNRCGVSYMGKTTTKILPWSDLEPKVVAHMNSLWHRRAAGYDLGLARWADSMDEVPLMFQENADRTVDFTGTTNVPIKSKHGDKRYVRPMNP